MKKIKFYIRAYIRSYPYWRVTFIHGEVSNPVSLREAIFLLESSRGMIWLDKKSFLK